MNTFRLLLASLVYHARMNLAVACGVAAGTAVLTGALLVGDSMHGSLRHLTLDRLGAIDHVLVVPQFFREQAAEELLANLRANRDHARTFSDVVPAIFLQTSLENEQSRRGLRASRVQLLGCAPGFWELGPGKPAALPDTDEIVLNQPLAEQLNVHAGDTVVVRLPKPNAIPADTPMGKKKDVVESFPLKVRSVIPAEGLGRFALQPNQQSPLNAYVPLDWLQARLDEPHAANMILVAGRGAQAASNAANTILAETWHPRLVDYGLRLEQSPKGYFQLTSERMLLEPPAEKRLLAALAGETVQPALTYLANTIACGTRQIPYSTITALDFTAAPPLGPMLAADGKPVPPLAEGQIALNRWAADDLQAKPGDTIRVSYFDPESQHGQALERSAEFTLQAIVEMQAAADDRSFTPEVRGVTDQRSMTNWQAPFPFDAQRVRPKDDRYWRQYRGTPKAFVSLATGRKLWSSRFGQTTALRIQPRPGMSVETLEQRLPLPPETMGFAFLPIKQQGLLASEGTTPFNVLFLAFSSFLIAAAVMLVALLFRLGVDGRAAELGILLATGWNRRGVRRLLLGEGLLVAAGGSLLGLLGGVGYAALMLAGLRTWWLAAVVTPFLQLYVTPESLAIGFFSGLLVALLAIAWSVRQAARSTPRQLLAGLPAGDVAPGGRPGMISRWLPRLLLVLALASVVLLFAIHVDEGTRAASFFGAGALVLTGALLWIRTHLRYGMTGPAVAVGGGNLLRLALRSAARRPGRSTLTIGLVASACFLILAVSVFHIDPAQDQPALDGGDGGFALVAQSDQPVYHDLNTPAGRKELDFTPEQSHMLDACTIFALRSKPGDDASCLNLYQPRRPRLLGLPQNFLARGGFAWDASSGSTPAEQANPWLLLRGGLPPDADGTPRVPVVLESATAMYSLHLWNGVGSTYDIADGRGGTLRLVVVGLLSNSIFQGDLLISEENLLKAFPDISGYRFFLIQTPPGQALPVRQALEGRLGDYGFAAETSTRRLAGFLAVQNTYLSTFQSLGSLGLLLGTVGLAAVQLRNVFERRGELALLRATGFRRRRLATMVLLENCLLLVAGQAVGGLAAVVATLPHWASPSALTTLSARALVTPGFSMAIILGVGLLVGLLAVRSVLATPLLAALRRE